MGLYAIDQYSLLHFAVGIIAYFWGFNWEHTLLAHLVFEYTENTSWGIRFINNYFTYWPGGKPYADSLLNQATDTLFTMLGWFISYTTDKLSLQHHLYKPS